MARVVEHDGVTGRADWRKAATEIATAEDPSPVIFLISLDIPGYRTTTSEGAVGDLRVGGRDEDSAERYDRETELVLEDVIFAGVQHSFFGRVASYSRS